MRGFELGDLQTAVEYAADLLSVVLDATSSDLSIRQAVNPLQRCIDSGMAERLRLPLLCLMQAGILSCFLRSAPDLESLHSAVGGSRSALNEIKEYCGGRETPASKYLQSVINCGESRLRHLHHTPTINHDSLEQHVEEALQQVRDLAPLTDRMEPRLVKILASLLQGEHADHVNAVAEIAQRHSLLRLPMREAPPLPMLSAEPWEFSQGEIVLRDPSCGIFEQMFHLESLHPSVLEGEYSLIAFQNSWLDLEDEHGDSSRASRKFVPLAWLAAKLVVFSDGTGASSETADDMEAICRQAVQLFDESTPDCVPFPERYATLRKPLLALAQEAEQATLQRAAAAPQALRI